MTHKIGLTGFCMEIWQIIGIFNDFTFWTLFVTEMFSPRCDINSIHSTFYCFTELSFADMFFLGENL